MNYFGTTLHGSNKAQSNGGRKCVRACVRAGVRECACVRVCACVCPCVQHYLTVK